nr:mast cell immunoglobulin like receptor 1 [Pipistrellus kuhlii]
MKKTNKCTSPSLYSETNIVVKGQNVSLSCSHQNQSLKITLFREKNCIGTIQESKGKPVIFNLSISEARDLGPYKCKAVFSNCTTYSPEFNFTIVGGDGCPLCLQLLLPLLMLIVILLLAFWIRQKYKARKAMRNKAPRDYGNTPTEVGIYANVHEDQAETEHSHEIHYATPMFLEVIPEVQNDDKTRCVYAELSL